MTKSKVWNNCKELSDGNWLDLEDDKQFSLNQNWTNSSSRDSFFISAMSYLITGAYWGQMLKPILKLSF